MGELGWTEQQTLDTTIPAIELALAGRFEFVSNILTAVFGKAEPESEDAPKRPTPTEVRSVVAFLAG